MKCKIIALIAALCSVFAGCSETSDALHKDGWRRIEPKELTDSPIVKVGSEWMALAAGNAEDMNAMTISWGTWGVLWGRPVVTVYVSSSRHTYSYMERSDCFTVTGFPQEYKPALGYIGSHSGRDSDKIKEAGLTVEYTPLGNPIFKEANLAIECKTLYKEEFDRDRVPDDIKEMYDKGTGVHTMYIGEIINVWIKE